MNKQEITIVVLLFALLMGWMFFQQQFAPPKAAPLPDDKTASAMSGEHGTNAAAATPSTAETAAKPPPELKAEPATNLTPVASEIEVVAREPEERAVLSNSLARVTVTSWGGGIVSVELFKFRQTMDDDSPHVTMDFADRPALSMAGIPGLSTNAGFKLVPGGDGLSVSILGPADRPFRFERKLVLDEGYRLEVTDTFVNQTQEAVALSSYGVRLGPMRTMEQTRSSMGLSYIGFDTLAEHGGEEVKYWGQKDVPAMFGYKASIMSCQAPDLRGTPDRASKRVECPFSWVAAKNKYFVQTLASEISTTGCEIHAARDMVVSNVFQVSEISGDLLLPDRQLRPGETYTLRMTYYAGPKQYDMLKKLGNHQHDVMEFGWFEWFRWICKALLWTLNTIYAVIPNYGIAIILLTGIVKIIFWPITHISTVSMKRMQEMQPMVNEIRAKFKDKPQKMNEEVMALYKKHKVNPMSGCLPMLVQVPVFIALFIVLRSAIELRFAGFLWIKDLSEAENLFAAVLPIPLNILPLIMTGLTVWQQKITPSAADPQQQKIMMIMPVIMLFLFYSMPSALVLYWSVSQVLSIVQMVMMQRKKPDAGQTPAPAPAG